MKKPRPISSARLNRRTRLRRRGCLLVPLHLSTESLVPILIAVVWLGWVLFIILRGPTENKDKMSLIFSLTALAVASESAYFVNRRSPDVRLWEGHYPDAIQNGDSFFLVFYNSGSHPTLFRVQSIRAEGVTITPSTFPLTPISGWSQEKKTLTIKWPKTPPMNKHTEAKIDVVYLFYRQSRPIVRLAHITISLSASSTIGD